jgi:hypothetical protein
MAESYSNLIYNTVQFHNKYCSNSDRVIQRLFRFHDAWIQLVISIFLFILWTPLGLYLFYLPYMILMKGEGKKSVFFIISCVTFIWFLIWSIANFADANGFIKVSDYFNA